MSEERAGAFDFRGPKTLVGPELKPGDAAPAFSLTNGQGQRVNSTEFAGTPMVISVVPSLDTGVCSIQTRRFEKEAANYGDKLKIITVSADLPFAQARWVKEEGAEHLTVLSDHIDMNFGDAYGTHVKEVRLDSRAVFVVDQNGIVQHVEYVPTAGNEPDYKAALAKVHELLK